MKRGRRLPMRDGATLDNQVCWRCDACGVLHRQVACPDQCMDAYCQAEAFTHFASVVEAKVYAELLLMEAAGRVSGIIIQPSFDLFAPDLKGHSNRPRKIGRAILDFAYTRTSDGQRVLVEVKGGTDTPLSKWKRKHLELQNRVTVEVRTHD